MIDRSREADAFLETIVSTDPGSITWCDGWTAHEIAAHVTGIAVEVNRHLSPFLQGDSVPKTRSFEEREAPLQSMDHDDLLVLFESEERRMRDLVAAVLEMNPDSVIPWTGRHMAVAKFIPHLRNEHALHRWDVVGEDQVASVLIGQRELTEHSVEVLGQILLVAGRSHDPAPHEDFDACLRTEGESDLYVLVRDQEATLSWDGPSDCQQIVECDAAARQLFIWGRHPQGAERLRSQLGKAELTRLQTLLSGY